ncbi:glutamate--tRNA ligase [Candidatus Berkelbacteria bacterium]|nr:glutamate--tRNA ligase [Candidatus Berkelbacteria bacterium]
MSDIRVRIAPSPTGLLHIGTARTALFNYLFARHYKGKFIVRIEDTDKERSTDAFTKDILDGLEWLGLNWDEGPTVGGEFGPYFQQEREHLYEQYVDQLLESKRAYRCYCTPDELSLEREQQQARGEAPKYSGKCRNLTEGEREQFELEGRESVIRFAIDNQSVEFDDLIKGHVSIDTTLMSDFVIVRSDGTPLFIFSNAVDDYLMKITHVLRGDDHLNNVPKQIMLNDALGFTSPNFGHFPLIFNTDRSKMSKRKDPVSITNDFKQKGYLPEAIINFVALLGWNPGTEQEIFSIEELINEFTVERVGKSPSIFDIEKLQWMNGAYIRELPIAELAKRVEPFISDDSIKEAIEKDVNYFHQALTLVKDRMRLLSEVEDQIKMFYFKPKFDKVLLTANKSTAENAKKSLEVASKVLTELKDFTTAATETALRAAAKENGLKDGEILWTVRVALSGSAQSPGTFELLEVLGKKESLERINIALNLC